MEHLTYMTEALKEAEEAFAAGEVPIGCVIVDRDGNIIGRGRNKCREKKNALYHAELIAINEACAVVGDFRLEDCVLYVTVEPCPMCAGAIVMSRIPTVVFGAKNPKAGCAGSVLDILREPGFNHRASVVQGVMEDVCGEIMSRFFENIIRKG